MHATHILHYFLTHACAWMHAARRQALAVSALAALTGRRVTVTALGRSIVSKTRAKLGVEHLVPRSGTPPSGISCSIINRANTTERVCVPGPSWRAKVSP